MFQWMNTTMHILAVLEGVKFQRQYMKLAGKSGGWESRGEAIDLTKIYHIHV